MSHSLRYEVNCSILFTELPLLERPAAAVAAGFEGVEFWWPFSEAVPSDGEVDAFVSAIQDAGVHLVGLNFFAGDMPAGDRGLVSWPQRSAEFRDNIDVTIGIGERLGCSAFIDRVGESNVGLLADLYHLAVNGDDVDAVIAQHADRVAHVQIADAPGRNEPGTGDLPLDRQLAALEEAGYGGWVGLEYKPATSSADSFDWLPRERRTAVTETY